MVLGIFAIITAIAIPNFSELLSRHRIATTANSLINQIKLAQSEAIRSAQSTTICVATTTMPTSCSNDAAANWSQGWIVWRDIDGDNVVDTESELIRHEGVKSSINFAGPLNTISFNAQGIPDVNGLIKVTSIHSATSSTTTDIRLLPSGQLFSSKS